jgi:anti-anti-sigma factor
MQGRQFEATVRAEGDGATIEMHGDVDRRAQDGLNRAYDETVGIDGRLLLDFGDVDYINSTGIALIVGVLARARAGGRAVAAFGLSDHYRELFSITRLSDFMTIYDSETAAVAAGE